jgi:hypothetical protein
MRRILEVIKMLTVAPLILYAVALMIASAAIDSE